MRTTANEPTESVSTARPAQAPMTALLTTPIMPAVVSMTEARHLADERERDQVAGQRGEVDAPATVCFGNRCHPSGLKVEVLRGRERDSRPEAVAEPSSEPPLNGRTRRSRFRRAVAWPDAVEARHCLRGSPRPHREQEKEPIEPYRSGREGRMAVDYSVCVVLTNTAAECGRPLDRSFDVHAGSNRRPHPLIAAPYRALGRSCCGGPQRSHAWGPSQAR